MQLRNKIVNYYVALPSKEGAGARVFSPPVTINDKIARELINQQLKDRKQQLLQSNFPLLHVCYDFDSGMLYLPNSRDFSRDQINALLPAAKLRIMKDFGEYSNRPPIEGSPFNSIRVRSINSFSFAKKAIGEHFKGKVFNDMPVIEAYLNRMPRTVKTLPSIFQDEEYLGGYISPSVADSITFVDEIDVYGNRRKEPKVLLTQKTPFILVNCSVTSQRKEPSSTEKEWVVLEGYRNYLYDGKTVKQEEKYVTDDLASFADLYAIKRQLYAGWPFEEVCAYLLRNISNFGSLMKAIDRLMAAAVSLANEGYRNPAEIPYLISFKIDNTFPLNISSLIDEEGRIDTSHQYPHFLILDYDPNNSSIIVRTPVYIPPEICSIVLKAKSAPFLAHYNPVVNKIDVKSNAKTFDDAKKERNQMGKIFSIVKSRLDEEKKKTLEFRTGEIARGSSSVDPNTTLIRRISDYPLAYDFIKKVCDEYRVPFNDVNVVVGPMERVLGPGTRGGFMDAKLFKQNKMKIPHELIPGIWISPPIIMIDSATFPSYAEQTDTLSHEYTHNIYSILHPEYEVTYGGDKERNTGKKEDEYKHWFKYFSDPSEIEAHKTNIRFELGQGKSYDEVIRDKVGGQITLENYPIALKFAQLVKEVMTQIEKEKEENEEPAGERQRSG